MRILLLHSRYRSNAPSGENRVVDEETALLRAAGHDVEVHAPSSDDIDHYGLVDRALLPARVVWSGRARHDVAAVVARFEPDVAHVHNTFPLLSASVFGPLRQAHVPVVATVHNYRLLCASGVLFREGRQCHECLGTAGLRGLRYGCYRDSVAASAPIVASNLVAGRTWRRDVTTLLCLSDAQRDLFVRGGFDPERVVVKPNFVVDQPPRRAPGQHLLYLGRLALEKGVRVLMAAWDELAGSAVLPLVIAGGGPLEQEVQTWASRRTDVRLLGHQDKAACAALVQYAAAVVAPSVWEETFGLVVIEAMAAGVPTVATDHGSFPSLITDDHDGVLVAPSDPTALATALRALAADPARSERLGQQGRLTYLRRFTPEANLAQLEAVYRQAIERT